MFLNSSFQTNDDRISIDGYNLMRADHANDSKKCRVCIYYEENIPLIKRNNICTVDNTRQQQFHYKGKYRCF